MASGIEKRWRRLLRRVAPFLFKQCPGGNWHWRTDRFCHCVVNEHWSDWDGGVYDFSTGRAVPDSKQQWAE